MLLLINVFNHLKNELKSSIIGNNSQHFSAIISTTLFDKILIIINLKNYENRFRITKRCTGRIKMGA